MIRLKKINSLQLFALTCSELTTLVNPNYLFVFINDMSKDEQKIVIADTSQYKDRYNLFQINGSFFTGEQWYSYKVYEQESLTNTDLELTGGLVEEGRAFLYSDDNITFTENNTTTNFKEYDGQ